MTDTMRALVTDLYGPVDNLHIADLERPEPGPGQVRVAVTCSALNPADYKVVTGEVKFLHGRSFPMVVGYDFAGTVDAVGDGVSDLQPGTRVYGFLAYNGSTKRGAFAEYVVADAGAMVPIPENVTDAVAAAAATPGLTALQSLRDLGRLRQGGRVLIIGASGGVGCLAVGIAKRLGATVTAVCRGHAAELVRELGADEIIDRGEKDPVAAAQGPFDVVLDAAAAHSFGAFRSKLASGGAYVTTLPTLRFVAGKLQSLVSSRRCSFVIVKAKRDDLNQLGEWLAGGLPVPIDSTYPIRDAAAALGRMQQGGLRGRIGIEVAGGF